MYELDPQVRREVEEALGESLPDRLDLSALSELERRRPDLYRKVVDGLVASSGVTFPSQAFRERARRRGRARRFMERVFMKPAWPEGMVVDRRRVMATILVAFAFLFLPAVYLANRASVRQARKPGATQATTPAHTAAPQTPMQEGVAEAAPSRENRQLPLPPSTRTGGDVASLPFLPPPPGGPPAAAGGPVSESGATSGGVFTYQAQSPAAEPSVFVYEKPAQTGKEPKIFIYTSTPPSEQVTAQKEESPSPLSAQGPKGSLDESASPSSVTTWKPGDIVSATLITGVATVSGLDPVPVVASSAPPGGCSPGQECGAVIWLGQARYSGGGRLSVDFFTLKLGDRVLKVQAIALGPDMTAGVPAKLSMKTPTLAAQLVSAAIGAAGDYFRALASRQQVTITNGWLTITQSGEPQFWQFLAGKIADLLRVGSSGPATVQVAEVSPKTQVNLLILQEAR